MKSVFPKLLHAGHLRFSIQQSEDRFGQSAVSSAHQMSCYGTKGSSSSFFFALPSRIWARSNKIPLLIQVATDQEPEASDVFHTPVTGPVADGKHAPAQAEASCASWEEGCPCNEEWEVQCESYGMKAWFQRAHVGGLVYGSIEFMLFLLKDDRMAFPIH